MKFLHAADIHLDSALEGLERYEVAPVDLIRGATRRALEKLVALALTEQVDFVVISGDLYNGNWSDYNTGLFFVKQMDKLSSAGIQLYLIAGNHDAANIMTRSLRLPANKDGQSIMLSHEMAETRRLDDLGVAIHGRSFGNRAELQNMVPHYPQPVPHWFNIGMLHTSLSGSEEHDTYAPCTPTDLRSKGYDYWALGHIHKRTVVPEQTTADLWTSGIYSGNIQGRHIREPGPRGCFVVTVDRQFQAQVKFHPLDVFRWEVVTLPCESFAKARDIYGPLQDELLALCNRNKGLPLGVRVELTGATVAHRDLTSHRTAVTAEIRSLAARVSHEQIWVEQVKFRTREPLRQSELSRTDGPLGELEQYLEKLDRDPAAISPLIDELKDLAKKLPSELLQPPDGLLLDNPDWIREVLQEVKPLLLDRLNG
ncbi:MULTISPECIES: exonuclease SbcCD subunit D [unclassified Schlesneria]|uniref:metallophosphoesterase family protein n=1 Tax=Schlesneria TaxID=656899 RepID=UPI0035A13BFF